jgi:replication factor C small subunit
MNVQNILWTEKYRPETLDDVVGHESAVRRFEQYVGDDAGGLPHSILHGPPGTGKTVVPMAWGNDHYGDDRSANIREFNASDERGIDVVRDKIKNWARSSPSGGYSYKVVFLDEADQLTNDAQAALRRIMEQYSDSTRFVLTCNYINQVIDPLQSRCATYHFGRLADDDIREVVENVIDGEDIDVPEPSVIDQVVRASDGKPRDAIVILRQASIDGTLEEEMVESVTGVVDTALVRDIFEEALAGNHDEAMRRFDVELLKNGANPDLLVEACFEVLQNLDMPPDSRVKAFQMLAEIDERIKMGLNPHVQFHALLGHVYVAQGISVYEQQEAGQ